MKKSILILFCLFSIFAQAQTIPLAMKMDLVTWVKLEPKDYLTGGKVGALNIEVRNYDVYKTSSGQFYVNYVDSKLVAKKKYLGNAFGTHEYEGNTVFFSADTSKAWIWTVDRYGQIFKMDLPDFFARDARIIKDSIQ
jgi:hypothetical protein